MGDLAVRTRSRERDAAYRQHRFYVLAVLARRCRWLADDERESMLHDAWAVLLEKERSGALDVAAMRPQQVRAYLTQTAINKALDEGRRSRSRDESLGERDDFETSHPTPDELVDAGMEGARVREIVRELTERQQQIVKLRFFLDRSPGEIQSLLGLTERAYRRDLERAMALISKRYELVRSGRFCESRASLIRAYVAKIAGPNRAREARAHIGECPSCRHYALQLRLATGQMAALLPMPAVALARGPLGHFVEMMSGGRDAVADLASSVKQHGAALATRVDPSSPLAVAGARPGTVAATLGACVALGGGTTYCAVKGFPPSVRELVGVEAPAKSKASTRPRRKPAARPKRSVSVARPPAVATPRPVIRSKPPVRSRPAGGSRSSKRAASRRKRSETAAVQEFGLEGAGTPAGNSGAPAVPPPAPRPAPRNAPPGEFDP